jgi:hypothetical protein
MRQAIRIIARILAVGVWVMYLSLPWIDYIDPSWRLLDAPYPWWAALLWGVGFWPVLLIHFWLWGEDR